MMIRFKWMSRALAAFGALTLATSLNANAQSSAIPDNAATYATYQGDVSEVGSRPLNSKSDIEQKLEALGGHNSGKLASGWLSYSALVAAQNRDFANSVRDIDAYYGRERLLAALEKNPGYFTRPDFAGSQQALNAALTAAKADESRMRRAAAFMEAQEASLQNQSWIKERIRDGKARADRLLSLSYSGRHVSPEARALFAKPDIGALLHNASAEGSAWDRASRLLSSAPGTALTSLTARRYTPNPSRTETTNHMAALAAFEIIGEASSSQAGVRKAMSDRKAEDCFDFAQMQLRGCVAGQSDHYGLQACMRQHAISDIGECVGEVAPLTP